MRWVARSPRKLWASFASTTRAARWLLPSLLGACSVYTTDLLETTNPVGTAGTGSTSNGGTGAEAGKGGTAMGGKGGEPMGAGGADGGEPPDVGGTGGTQGGSPASGGTAGSVQGGAGAVSGGGSSGTGGTAGTGGTGGTTSNPGLIDGFEDKDTTLEEGGGLSGVWYPFDDGTGGTAKFAVSALMDEPADLGNFAMHVTATGFTDFGSGVGADFIAGKKPFNAATYTGIRFRAKIAAGSAPKHRLQIADATTEAAGGKCKGTADATKCGAHFGTTLTVTTTWATYQVLFESMTQPAWGLQAEALDKAALYGLQITSKSDALDVDLWIDQIEFI